MQGRREDEGKEMEGRRVKKIRRERKDETEKRKGGMKQVWQKSRS